MNRASVCAVTTRSWRKQRTCQAPRPAPETNGDFGEDFPCVAQQHARSLARLGNSRTAGTRHCRKTHQWQRSTEAPRPVRRAHCGTSRSIGGGDQSAKGAEEDTADGALRPIHSFSGDDGVSVATESSSAPFPRSLLRESRMPPCPIGPRPRMP